MKEIWKPIEDYENYMVSNLGRVKSLNYRRTGKEKILKPFKARGYLVVDLLDGTGKKGRKTNFIHRLVAQAFIPNPLNLPEVNHIDEDKLNNCVDNLEWCDRSYNVNYGNRNKNAFETLSKTNTCKQPKPILQYSIDGNFIKEWSSACEVQRQLGYYQRNIRACCNGKSKKSHNFLWRYKKVI